MTQKRYDVGDVARLSVTTMNLAGTPTDATSVTLWSATPAGAVSHATAVHDGTGLYHYDLALPSSGTWSYWWVVAGAVVVEGGGILRVSPRLVELLDGPAGTAFPTALVTVTEVRDHLSITSTVYDGKLQGYIDAAADVVEEIADIVIPRTLSETYDGGGGTIQLRRSPVLTVASVAEYRGTTAYTLTAAANPSTATGPYHYSVDLSQGLLRRLSAGVASVFAPGNRSVFVTYTAGKGTVPARVRLAALELIAHWWRWGQHGTSTVLYQENVDLGVTAMGYAVPHRVTELLRPLPGIA